MSSSIDIASDQTVNNTPVGAPTAPSDGDQYGSSLFPSAPNSPQLPVQQPQPTPQPEPTSVAPAPVQPINVQFPSGHVVQFPSAAHATQHAASVWGQIKSTVANGYANAFSDAAYRKPKPTRLKASLLLKVNLPSPRRSNQRPRQMLNHPK